MADQLETYEFQSEAKQVLDLMVHSVYSHPEIFLRELISNCSDALDKLRFEALTREDWGHLTSDLHIRIEPDPNSKILTVSDTGIGMSREEVKEFIGTIAKSGSREFLRILQESRAKGIPPELIGQFGVGFYSCFMVADRVRLVTQRAGEEKATCWESSGEGSYTLEEVEKPEVGTSVTLHLKESAEEESFDEYTLEWKIRQIIKKYSDYVAYPIRMKVQREEVEKDEEGNPKPDGKRITVVEDETLNSMKAIWTRPENEVTEAEYNEFYKHISHDWNEPLAKVVMKAEGTIEFRALLYVPSRAPFDLYMPDASRGIHLYIRRIFIMSDCEAILPEYLRFIRGVVDSEDLPLNISREILQQNRHVKVIRKSITKKILETLRELSKEEKDQYRGFWNEFGRVLKEGLTRDQDHRESLLDLCRFSSTHDPEALTSLEAYMDRMKENQDTIYFMTGENRRVIENSPHLEMFKEKGYEVLLLTDPVDEIWVQWISEYKEKKLQSIGKGTTELGTEEEREKVQEGLKEKQQCYGSLLKRIQTLLDESIKEVRLSNRLTSSPACLVGESSDMSPHLERLLRGAGQEVPKIKRILEINPNHPVLEELQSIYKNNVEDSRIQEAAELLHGQAILAEGGQLPDPARFSKLVSDLLVKGLAGTEPPPKKDRKSSPRKSGSQKQAKKNTPK